MRLAKLIRIITASCTLLISPVVFAAFSTYSKDWPDDGSIVDERVTSPVKTSTTTEEDDSQNFLVVTQDQINKRIDDKNRLYAKLGMTFLTAQIRNITNTSSPLYSSATVVDNSANEDYMSWEFALGTTFQYVRLEAEYFYEKNIPYNSAPLFAGVSGNITSNLKSQSVWLEMDYDMKKLNIPYFTPYFGGLAGFVWNKTRTAISTISNNAAQNHSRYCLGWGVTIGARMAFWTRWYGYVGYKYLDHGMARWQSANGTAALKGHYVVQGVDLGVQYLLGAS
ncbi:MAG TPA: hypothetical protein VLG38_05970 [Gammaproteobacteria bacterium]|nr:hypothetical protein [Gammaproteobacteria bacterium]